jgi:hypothetical protein
MTAPEAISTLVMFDPDLSYSVNECHGSRISSADGQRRDSRDWYISAQAVGGDVSMRSGFHETLEEAVAALQSVIHRQRHADMLRVAFPDLA